MIKNINMGLSQSILKVNFETIQNLIKNNTNSLNNLYYKNNNIYLINTLNNNEQNCLISSTIPYNEEENLINKIINNGNQKEIIIILYGKNSNDNSLYNKYNQLINLGFSNSNVYIYLGGLFEWLLLQDIYGYDLFPTTSKELDLLKYKSNQLLNISLLEY